MTNSFEGKVVLITGAGKGKGRALAKAFSARGAFVAVNDISPINLDELVSQGGGRIKAYVDDVAKKVAAQAIINQVEDDFGGVDILINHAAVEPRVDLLTMDEWDWHRVLDVNLTGTFLMMQSAGRVMRAKGSLYEDFAGVIINLITATRRGLALSEVEGSGKEAAYLASMAGLAALTRSASIEFASYGVHVHAVGTGFPEFHHADPSVPADLIEAVLYLCRSDLNGQILNLEER